MIEGRNLTKIYKTPGSEVVVFDNLNLRIEKGKLVSIIGASGAGKSTLLHLFGGLDTPTGGTVEFNGSSLFSLSGTGRTRLRNEQIGFVFQSYNLLPELDALENVCVPALVAGRREAAVYDRGRELLKSVGLAE